MSDRILADVSSDTIIDVPFEKVDIAEWLLNLPTAEYKRCSPDHIACGASFTDDGRRMSIAVEKSGEALVVQKYVGEPLEAAHCRMVSESDAFDAAGQTTVGVVWTLSVEAVDAERCRYTNAVLVTATDDFVAHMADQGVTVEQAAELFQQALTEHNAYETPRFGQSIAHHALSDAWAR
jgi:hypothetical protein